MWIEAPNKSTRNLTRRTFDDDGALVDVFAADFNHNGRAEVTKKAGEFLLADVPALKAVKDGGPPPQAEPTEDTAAPVNEEETTDE